jgi:hypothetical protein
LSPKGAAAWPLAARAQPAGKVWRIGLLQGASRSAASGLYSAFVQGMREIRLLDRAIGSLDKKSIGERRRKYLVGYPAWSTPMRSVGLSAGFGFDH